MADILSQEELDALLGQMKQGELDEELEAVEIDPQPRRRGASGGESMEGLPGDSLEGAGASAEEVPATEEAEYPMPNLRLILDLPILLSVELGRTRMTVHEIMQLGQGSVLELNRMASDLIDLTINNRVVAQGEAVVVNESFGFRVVEVDSVRERINKL